MEPFATRPGEEARRRDLETVLSYHERTKHRPERYARSLGHLDWKTQPDPFRTFEGAPRIELDEVPPGPKPSWRALHGAAPAPPRPLDRSSVSQLFYDSLAISAWKEFHGSRWSLRVNPSSGDLHPTEGYLLAGPLPGIDERPGLYHYAPCLHELERRMDVEPEEWEALSAGLPGGAILLGFTSIPWRESWKYGERAFRYCQHDAGHAIAAAAIAAAILGWEARLLEGVLDDDLAALLGTRGQDGPEAERPECLMALFPRGGDSPLAARRAWRPPPHVLDRLRARRLHGAPNRLSSAHHAWPIIDLVATAARRDDPPEEAFWDDGPRPLGDLRGERGSASAREILRRRRSAVAMDGTTWLSRDAFLAIVSNVLPARERPPFDVLPWRPAIHPVLFVHRVRDLEPGLYVLPRSERGAAILRVALRRAVEWTRVPGCPEDLPLWRILADDVREAAQGIACQQEIASDGAFAVGMLAEYEEPLATHGGWFYKRLHWEAGALGQVLYLEAEAEGVRGTGIGCFFDDLMHSLLGIQDRTLQTLYHFTIGGAVEDSRLRTLPAYHHRGGGGLLESS